MKAIVLRFCQWRPPGWVCGLFLLVAVAAVYQPAGHAGFIWDDDDYVTGNPLLSAPDGWWRIWFSTASPSQYFPLTYTLFRVEYNFFGFHAAGYHWVNILLHGINSILVWRLLSRLDIPGAWLAAAIFALHPVQVESVAWITEGKNVLMCFFFLLSVLGWIEFIGQPADKRWWFYLSSLLCLVLALFSKTTACTLPAALLLVLWLKGKKITRRHWLQIAPFLVVSLGMGLLTVWWERNHIGTRGDMFSLDLPERVLIASHALWFYLGKLLWPVNLTFSYPRWTIDAHDPSAYGWLVLLGGWFMTVYFLRRFVGRSLETAVLFYVATLSPMLGFIMLYTFRYTYVADHYQYVACIGPITLVAAVVFTVLKKQPFIRPVLVGILLLTLGAATWRQSGTYADAETLWRTTITRNPGSWMAYGNLGAELFKNGKPDEAMACYEKALELNPDYEEAHNNLGVAWFKKGRVDAAIEHYQKALTLQPGDWQAAYNLGNAFFQQGNLNEAIACFQKAVTLQPASAEANCHLGNALFQNGQWVEAILYYQAALKNAPDYTEAWNNLGSVYLRQKKWDQAIISYQRALRINSGLAALHDNLGDAYFQAGQWTEAAAEFHAALAIQPNDTMASNNLNQVLHELRK